MFARGGANGEGFVCLDRCQRGNEGFAFNGENQSVRSFLSFNNVSEEVRAFFPKPSIAPWFTASFCASSKLLTSIIGVDVEVCWEQYFLMNANPDSPLESKIRLTKIKE